MKTTLSQLNFILNDLRTGTLRSITEENIDGKVKKSFLNNFYIRYNRNNTVKTRI